VNDTFKNKRVILLFDFNRIGVSYRFLGDSTAKHWGFFQQVNFHVSEFMASFPQNSKEKIKIEFLGHILLYDDVLVHRFLMEEKYRN